MGGSVAHPEGEGRRRGRTPLGGTGAAADVGAGADDAETHDDDAVAPLAVMPSLCSSTLISTAED